MANNILDATKQVTDLTKAFNEHVNAISNARKELDQLNRQYAKVPSDFIRAQQKIVDLEKQQQQSRNKLNSTTKEAEANNRRLKRSQEALSFAQSETGKQTVRNRQQTSQLNKETRALSTAYGRLKLRLDTATKDYRELAATIGVNADKTVRVRQEVIKLRNSLKAIDGPIRNTSIGLKGVTSIVTGLVGAFGLVEGIRIAFDFGREAAELSRQARGVQFAFNRLGEEGVKAFSDVKRATRGALADLDIQRSLVEFDNLGIQLDTAGVAFEFLNVRATQTGRSIDSLREDLVTGLGRGSVRILDNLGLSMAELNRLTKEEGLSIQEAFGVIAQREINNAGDILDDAGNSADRFNASLENTKLAIGDLITGQGIGFFGFLSDALDRLTVGFKNLLSAIQVVRRGFEDFIRPIVNLLRDIPILNTIFTKTSSVLKTFFEILSTPGINVFAAALRRLGAVLSGIGASFGATRDAAINFIKTLATIGEIDFSLNPIENFRNIRDFVGRAKDSLVEGGTNIGEAFSKAYTEALNRNFPRNIPTPTGTGGGAGRVSTTATGTAQRGPEVEGVGAPALQGLTDLPEIEIPVPDTDEATEALQSVIDGYNKITEVAKNSAEQQKQIFSTLFSSFADMYNVDIGAFTKLFDEKMQTTENYAEAAGEALNFVINMTRANYDADIQANKERLDAILNDDNANEEQKEIARKRASDEEKRLKTKQAKADRNAALLQIGVDTAVAVVKALAVGPPQGFVLAAIVGALGLAQAAFVASQPLPQFEKGTKSAPRGWAITQEKRPEPITDKHGRLKTMGNSGGDQLTYLEQGDKVYPSRDSFFKENIASAAVMTSISSQNQQLSSFELGSIFDKHLESMKNDVKQGVKEGLRGFNNNIRINNKVDIGHITWLNKKGY